MTLPPEPLIKLMDISMCQFLDSKSTLVVQELNRYDYIVYVTASIKPAKSNYQMPFCHLCCPADDEMPISKPRAPRHAVHNTHRKAVSLQSYPGTSHVLEKLEPHSIWRFMLQAFK